MPSYSSLGYLFSESFTNPVVFGSPFDFVQQSGARRRDLPGFHDRAFYTQSRLERDIPWDLRVYFGYGLEFARPFNLPVETLIRLEGTQPEKTLPGFLCPPGPAPGHHGQPRRPPSGAGS